MLVPWNDVLAVVDDGLWSMLSTADVVKSFVLRAGGQTTPSSTYWHTPASPSFADISRTLSYDTQSTVLVEHINKSSFSGPGEDRQSQVHRKGCFTFIAMSVGVGFFRVVGKAVVLQQLGYGDIRYRWPLLKLWLDVCAVFNHAHKCNKWRRDRLLNTSIEESVVNDGLLLFSMSRRISSTALVRCIALTVLGCLG